MRPSSVTALDSSVLIRSELLCYGMNNVHNCTAHSLANCINEFYHPEEIFEARNQLLDLCQALLSGKQKTRRPLPPTDKATARPFVDDICSWLCTIADSQEPFEAKFYALDLRRVPPCAPEEVNLFSIVARIEALEKKPNVHTTEHQLPPASETPLSRPTPSSAAIAAAVTAPAAVTRPSAAQPPPSEAPTSNTWATVVNKKKKKLETRRRVRNAAKELPVVVGTSSDSSLKSCGPLKHLFVYGVDNACSSDALKDYMRKKNVQPKDVRRVSKDSWIRASFKVAVEDTCVKQTLDASFWPEGIMCREWLQTIPQKTPLDNATAAKHTADDAKDDDNDDDDGDGDDVDDDTSSQNGK